ncbi:MAG: transposase, partial [Planctomycetota bacterium]
MPAALFHLTLCSRDRRTIAVTESDRRRLVRSIASVGATRLIVFCLVDDHLHVALKADRAGVAAN